jgi:predicted O-methyltransferase YrrM
VVVQEARRGVDSLESRWLRAIAGRRLAVLTGAVLIGIVWMSPAVGIATAVIVLHIVSHGGAAQIERLEVLTALRQEVKATSHLRAAQDAQNNQLTVVQSSIDGLVSEQRALQRQLDQALVEINEVFHQTESLVALYVTLKPPTAIPSTRSWVMSPDLLRHLAQTVRDKRPQIVLEAGSGVSTAVIALALKQNGSGRVVALEHLGWAKAETEKLLGEWGVTDYAEVRLAPLEDWVLECETYKWYAPSSVPDGEFDLIIVDGPPGSTNRMARYPAGKALLRKMSSSGCAILDDTNRADEVETVQRWKREIDGLDAKRLRMEKGAIELRWNTADTTS